ncbi:MAG TPA: hypothetical protein PL045_10940, partial [Chitinophagaceae bacterium]|nr:hypothetical protein [Chitinophagaceae bacterium]
ICNLVFKNDRNAQLEGGTGFFIGPKTIMTAAHGIWDRVFGSKISNENIIISPARNGPNVFPFKNDPDGFASFNPVDTILPSGFTASDLLTAKDYAILHIERPIGEITGYFGQGITAIDKLGSSILQGKLSMPIKQQDLNICGYPGNIDDKTGSRQYLSYNYGFEFLDGGKIITYLNDTSGGMSGSPIWIKRSADNGGRIIVGIHIDHGTQIKRGYSKFNRGVFITDEVRSFIQQNTI